MITQKSLRGFLVLVSLATTLTSVYVSFLVVEKFFFDKLFYKKSAIYGYSKIMPTKTKNNWWIDKRMRDYQLVYAKSIKNPLVLGAKTDDDYSIALIGDSVSYGLGVKENEVFGRVLEQELNKIRPTKVYILASPGDSIVENYAKFLAASSFAEFDLYIVALLHNDLIYDHFDKYTNEAETYDFLSSSCPGEEFIPISNWWSALGDKATSEAIVPSFSPMFANRCYLQTAVKAMTGTGSRVLFFPLDKIREGKLGFFDEMNNWVIASYKNIVTSAGGIVIDGIEELPSFEYRDVSKKEGHPSPNTHRQYAEALYQEITTNPRWGF